MRSVLFAAVAIAALPGLALAQAKPLLLNPADLNKDGVVTDDERADYLARKAAGVQDQPALPVAAPKPSGVSTTVMGKPGSSQDYQTGIAGEAPAAASDFERATEDGIRRNAAKDD